MPAGPYRAKTCRERELTLDHIHTYSLDEGSAQCRGHFRDNTNMKGDRYTPFTHPFILSRRIWKDDYDGKWYSGTLWAWSFPTFVLQVRKHLEKTSPRKLVPTGIEPERAAWQTRMLPHAPQSCTCITNYYCCYYYYLPLWPEVKVDTFQSAVLSSISCLVNFLVGDCTGMPRRWVFSTRHK